MFGNPTRFAWFFLITLVTIIYRSAGEPSQKIICHQPVTFTVQINDTEYFIHDTEIFIKHNPYVGIFSYPDIKPVNIFFNETVIEFEGYMSPQYPLNQTKLSKKLLSKKISGGTNGFVLGIGTLQKLSTQNYAVEECKLFFQTDIQVSDVPKAVQEAITYYGQLCASKHLCENIGIIDEKEIQNINKYNEFGSNVASVIQLQDPKIDLNMNIPVDIILEKVQNYIERTDQAVLNIPNIEESYGFGLMKASFDAFNGTFRDLSTIRRTADAIMSNIGRTQVLQAGFGLSIAKVKFDHYKLKVGLVPVSGELEGGIDGLAVAAKLVIDYDKKCGLNVEYLKVTEFGKINLHMTGLGPLSGLTSSVLTWLTEMLQGKIIQIVEVNVREIAEEQLKDIICNQFY